MATKSLYDQQRRIWLAFCFFGQDPGPVVIQIHDAAAVCMLKDLAMVCQIKVPQQP